MKAVYVHVPFCRDICAYCDFTRCRYHAGLADQWLIAVKRELQEKLAQVSVETVYIGGGTPSALNSRQLEQLLKLLAPYTTQVQEYTVLLLDDVFSELDSYRKQELLKSLPKEVQIFISTTDFVEMDDIKSDRRVTLWNVSNGTIERC